MISARNEYSFGQQGCKFAQAFAPDLVPGDALILLARALADRIAPRTLDAVTRARGGAGGLAWGIGPGPRLEAKPCAGGSTRRRS